MALDPSKRRTAGAGDHLRVEPAGRRLEISLGGAIVVSIGRALALHEKGSLATSEMSSADVRLDQHAVSSARITPAGSSARRA